MSLAVRIFLSRRLSLSSPPAAAAPHPLPIAPRPLGPHQHRQCRRRRTVPVEDAPGVPRPRPRHTRQRRHARPRPPQSARPRAHRCHARVCSGLPLRLRRLRRVSARETRPRANVRTRSVRVRVLPARRYHLRLHFRLQLHTRRVRRGPRRGLRGGARRAGDCARAFPCSCTLSPRQRVDERGLPAAHASQGGTGAPAHAAPHAREHALLRCGLPLRGRGADLCLRLQRRLWTGWRARCALRVGARRRAPRCSTCVCTRSQASAALHPTRLGGPSSSTPPLSPGRGHRSLSPVADVADAPPVGAQSPRRRPRKSARRLCL